MSKAVSPIAEPTIYLMAGEPSGDQHAAALARSLRGLYPGARLVGMGGEEMKQQGVDLLAELDALAVMGLVEVLAHLPRLWRVERRVLRRLARDPADLVVLIDYPGLNMRLAKAAKGRGIPVLYYVAPKVWAWRPDRARRLAAVTDRVAAILPFEVDFLREYGVDARYVGNPLLDRPAEVLSRGAFCEVWGLDPSRRFLAVLPGSRGQELDRHLGRFAEVARRVESARPEVLPIFSRAPSLSSRPFHEIGFPMVTDTRALLRHADAALVKSGTATLECALEDTPMVVAYRTSAITAWLARRVLRVDHVSLPNLITGEAVVPEFLQEHVDPPVVADALLQLLTDGERRRRQLDGLVTVRERLGEPGATKRVAELCAELLGGDA